MLVDLLAIGLLLFGWFVLGSITATQTMLSVLWRIFPHRAAVAGAQA